MTDRQAQLIERLRRNTLATGIRLDDADLTGIQERGFLSSVLAFEELIASILPDVMTAYLRQESGRPPGGGGCLPCPAIHPRPDRPRPSQPAHAQSMSGTRTHQPGRFSGMMLQMAK